MLALRSLAAALAVAALALPATAYAQSAESFAAWGARLGKAAQPCPLQPVSAAQALQNPFFDFNGDKSVASFSCQQIGPFQLNPSGPWFMQNVKGLKPPGECVTFKPNCRVNSIRVCSLAAANGTAGPFGGPVGRFRCEKLWDEEYRAPADPPERG